MIKQLRFKYICQTLNQLIEKHHLDTKKAGLEPHEAETLKAFAFEASEASDETQIRILTEKLLCLQSKLQKESNGHAEIGLYIKELQDLQTETSAAYCKN